MIFLFNNIFAANQTQYIEPITYKYSLSKSMSDQYPGLATVGEKFNLFK